MFIMLGSLRIEIAFMALIGDWVKRSSWTDLFNTAKISTIGRVQNFLVGNKAQRIRYAHQMSLPAFTSLATEAFHLRHFIALY